VRTIRFRSVVFGVTSSLAVIHTIHCPPWLCIVRECPWSVSRCRTTATLTGYRAWRLVVEYPHIRNKRKTGRRCDLQITLQQVLIAKPDIRWESRFLPTPPAFEAPIRKGRGFPSEYCHAVWYGKKLDWWSYPMVKKNWYVYSFWHNSRTWQTDRQTDTTWRQRPRLMPASRGKNLLLYTTEVLLPNDNASMSVRYLNHVLLTCLQLDGARDLEIYTDGLWTWALYLATVSHCAHYVCFSILISITFPRHWHYKVVLSRPCGSVLTV